jgi:hypothetical protein
MREPLEIEAQLSWRVAETMPLVPHEYTLRQENRHLRELYFHLFEIIQRDGVIERWRKQERYLYLADRQKYWAMSTDMGRSKIINRMLAADDLPRLIRERQISHEGSRLRNSRKFREE